MHGAAKRGKPGSVVFQVQCLSGFGGVIRGLPFAGSSPSKENPSLKIFPPAGSAFCCNRSSACPLGEVPVFSRNGPAGPGFPGLSSDRKILPGQALTPVDLRPQMGAGGDDHASPSYRPPSAVSTIHGDRRRSVTFPRPLQVRLAPLPAHPPLIAGQVRLSPEGPERQAPSPIQEPHLHVF